MSQASRGERTCKICGRQVARINVKTYKGKATCLKCIEIDQELGRIAFEKAMRE